jgi:hypothetical protein
MEKTPQPAIHRAPPAEFVKHFEDTYLLSRELQVLTDLGQRGAPVPRVLATNYEARTITMTHGGIALPDEFTKIGSRHADKVSWLRTSGPQVLNAILLICHHGVYHLDLACRNILISQGRPLIVDFGLALCSRFPLQKPLWLIPSEKLHHPSLIAALQSDWNAFFLHSPELREFCAKNGLACPPPLTNGLSLPASAYSRYWPAQLTANAIADPMLLVAYNVGALLDEISQYLGITGNDARAIGLIRNRLQSLSDHTPAAQRIQEAVAALEDLGGTPRPRLAGVEGPSASPHAQADSAHRRHAPPDSGRRMGEMRRMGLWPPSRGLRWPVRAGAVSLTLLGFAAIDAAYRDTGAVLGDSTFIAALFVLATGLGLVVTLAFLRGLLAQRMLSLVLAVLSLPFISELWQQGASIPQVGAAIAALVTGLVLAVALPSDQ